MTTLQDGGPDRARSRVEHRRWIAIAYLLLFLAALLQRFAAFTRGDYMPWWDGVGWTYADSVWIQAAVDLAAVADLNQLNFAEEGFIYVPLMAVFLKLFGLHGGMLGWTYFLIGSSALIAVAAAATVHAVTGRLIGGIVAGAWVIFDPVLAWFGLNGWPDGMTMVMTALSFLAFVLAARKPSLPRLIGLGIALALLALSHTTWLWPSAAWAVLAWPLLAVRHRWLPPPEAAPAVRGRRMRAGVPLLAYLGVLVVTALFFVLAGGSGLTEESIPIFSVDSNNQRVLVVSYDPSIAWNDWKTSDTPRVIATRFVPVIPRQLSTLLHGYVANPIPLYAWLLVLLGGSAALIALTNRSARRPSVWGLAGLPVFAFFALQPEGGSDPSVFATLLVLAVMWLFIPVSRVLLLLAVPFLGVLLLYIGILTQLRHSVAIVYLLYLLTGIGIDLALIGVAGRLRRFNWSMRLGAARVAIVGAALVALVGLGAVSSVRALARDAEEERYLAWLGSAMPADAVLFTSGNVDPWEVREITGHTIFYDVENGGRLILDGSPSRWGRTLVKRYPDPIGSAQIVEMLRRQGQEPWFYRPGAKGPDQLLTLNMVPEPSRPTFVLIPAAAYPADPSRYGYVLGQPVEGG